MNKSILEAKILEIRKADAIKESDLWDLANHLNEDGQARRTWPGAELFPLCQNAYAEAAEGTPDLQPILEFIRNLDLARLDEATGWPEGLTDVAGLQVHRLQLRGAGAVDIREADTKCDCSDWGENRLRLVANSPGRLCCHRTADTVSDSNGAILHPDLRAVIQRAARLEIGLQPESNWMRVVNGPHRFVAAWSSPDQLQFFALGSGERVTHFTRESAEGTWSIGTRYDHKEALGVFVDWITGAAASPEPSQPQAQSDLEVA